MYKKKDYVSDLVSSLNKDEKRQFTLFYGESFKGEAPPLFYQLYSVYENSKSELPKNKLHVVPTSITSAKRRLYHNLLRTLRDMNEKSSTDIFIQNKLTNVELLYNHSLPEQSVLELNKAYSEAQKFEKFGLMLQLLEWEKRLNIVLPTPTRSLSEIKKEEREILKKFSQQLDMETMYSHILELKREIGYAKGKDKRRVENATIKSDLMPKESECLSNNASFYRHYIYSIYYWMIFNHKEAYNHSSQLIKYDQHNIQPNDYIHGIFQHITSSVCMGLFTDTLNGISLAEAFTSQYRLNQSLPFSGILFAYHVNYKMIVLNYMGEQKQLKDFVQKVELRLRDSGKTIPADALQIILANLMVSYMGLDLQDKAVETRKRLLDLKKKISLRLDILTDVYFFQIFILMQEKSYELIKPAAESALRFFRKNEDAQKVFEVEMPIALLLSKPYNYEDKKVLPHLLSKCKKIVNDYIAKLKCTLQFQEHYTRYVIWFDAIEKKKPFHEAAKEWYKEFKNTD
jgi:tetratricopeptide (TPR) repeat protein